MDAQADRISKEAVYQLAQSGNYEAIPAIRDSTVIQDIVKQESALNAQYADALAQYGPKFPKVDRLQAQIKQMDDMIAHEKQNIVNQVEAEYRGSHQREMLLQQALDEQKAEANQTAEKLVQYNILKREAEANKQLYDDMLQKLKEAGIQAGLRSSNIRVVDPALVPSGASRPQKARNIMLGFLVGLVGGIGLALLAGVSGQYDQDAGRHRIAGAAAIAGGGAGIRHRRRPPEQPLLEDTEVSGGERQGRPRGTCVASHAAVADVRGVSRLADLAAALPGGSSAASDPDDQRAAARRQDDGRRQSRRDPGATGRQDAAGGCGSSQARHQPGAEPGGRQTRRSEFLSCGRLIARLDYRAAPGDYKSCMRFRPARFRRTLRICSLRAA